MPHRELIVALLATLAVQLLTSVAVFTPAILAPSAHRDIGVAANAIGIFISLTYAFAALSAPIGGTFVARLGAVRVSQACLLFAGGGLAVCGLVYPVAVIAGAVMIGISYGPPTPASSALLIERTPDRLLNLVMSIRQTGVPVGGAFAGAVVLLCVVYGASAFGWNGVYIAEVARVAPEGKVAIATGGSLAVTYFGVVVGPFFFWLIVTVTGSYAIAFGSAALVTCAAAVSILRRKPAPPTPV